MKTAKTTSPALTPAELIAPCGMNCAVCYGHLRLRHQCPGCRGDDTGKPKTRTQCRIKTCAVRAAAQADSCAGCAQLPCFWLSRLDRRYREKYGMSMLENLAAISALGVERFAEQERSRWICSGCGATLCVHQRLCPVCQRPWR